MAIEAQNPFYNLALNAVSATNGANILSGIIDTKGYHYLNMPIWGTTADVVSDSPSVIQLLGSDTTASTSFVTSAALSPWVGGTAANNFAIPNSPTATSTQPYALFNVDLRGKPRYLKLSITPRTTQTYSALAMLTRADQVPVGSVASTNQGVSGIVVTG